MKKIICDNGSQFLGKFKSNCDKLHIDIHSVPVKMDPYFKRNRMNGKQFFIKVKIPFYFLSLLLFKKINI